MVASESRAKHRDGPIVIKKYANRRLYNTAKSSYVTLDDLSQMVRAGDEFQVFDAKTGEEITRSVLTQIIFEQEAKGSNMLPTKFLRQLIRLYGGTMQSMVPGYLDASMEAFHKNQERIRAAMGGQQAMATFEAMARSNMEWFEQAMRMFSGIGPTRGADAQLPPQSGSGAPTAGGASAPLSEDLGQLQRQLAEMQAQLERLSQTPREPVAGPNTAPRARDDIPADDDDTATPHPQGGPSSGNGDGQR